MPVAEVTQPLTDDQMRQLEGKIVSSPHATPFAKRAAIWLLRQTKNLSVPVKVVMEGPESGPAEEAAYGIHDMCSSGNHTKLNHLIRNMGSPMAVFSATKGLPHTRHQRVIEATLWVSARYCDFPEQSIQPDYSAIKSITL